MRVPLTLFATRISACASQIHSCRHALFAVGMSTAELSPPRAPQSRLTHLVSCSPAALAVTRTLSVSRAPKPPDSACALCCRSTHDVGAGRATCTSTWRPLASSKLGAPADHLAHTLFACAFHSTAALSLSRSAMHLHCKGLERRALHVLNLPCRACVRALQLRVPILFSGLDRREAARSRAAHLVCSSRLLKPPAHNNHKPPAQPQAPACSCRTRCARGPAA